jgi:hypothetical protein
MTVSHTVGHAKLPRETCLCYGGHQDHPTPQIGVFFSVVYVKDTLYLSVLPRNLDDLQQNIATDIALIGIEMLEKFWAEMGYRVYVCRSQMINSLKNCEVEPKFQSFYYIFVINFTEVFHVIAWGSVVVKALRY